MAGAAVGGGVGNLGEGGDVRIAAEGLAPGQERLVHPLAVAELAQCLQDVELEVERAVRDVWGVGQK